MVYPRISDTFCQRVTSFLVLVNIILTITWTQSEASLTPELTLNEGSLAGNPSLSSSMDHQKMSKRSVSVPEEAFNRWNLINPSSSSSVSSSSSDNSPSSSSSIPVISAPFSAALTDEYETDLDSSDPSLDSDLIKRDGARYAFGLGKRASSPESRYAFGIGKRTNEFRYLGSNRRPGLGKKSRHYSFGLGKRDLYEYIKRRYNFGIGKRAPAQRYAFGLGK